MVAKSFLNSHQKKERKEKERRGKKRKKRKKRDSLIQIMSETQREMQYKKSETQKEMQYKKVNRHNQNLRRLDEETEVGKTIN